MELPVWHFVGIGSGLIIGIVSVLHVFVAQFAVGGGIYLVWMERKAYRDGAPEILQWLERHTHFFLLLTMVFGGLSGVGIWFTMSVVNPGATSMLIHNFVFFWAAEWGLFLLEVVSLLAYYYTYPWSRSGRMSPETHMRIGIVYACAGFLSLVLINGIITFMLTPGQGLATGNVWLGFFNPTYWPSVVVRLGICLILAGMFALFTAPRIASGERPVDHPSLLFAAGRFRVVFHGVAAGSAGSRPEPDLRYPPLPHHIRLDAARGLLGRGGGLCAGRAPPQAPEYRHLVLGAAFGGEFRVGTRNRTPPLGGRRLHVFQRDECCTGCAGQGRGDRLRVRLGTDA